MLKIIRFRKLEYKDLQFGRLLKPFEDAGLVEVFENTEENVYQLVCDICNDKSEGHYHFSHILNVENSQETPTSLYHHIRNLDDTVPTLCVSREFKNRRKEIRAIRNYHELQGILGYAVDRGYVKDAQRFL